MLTRDFHLKVKGLESSGSFSGFASTYGNVDLVGDVIEPGAFQKTITSQGKGLPLLWSHKQDEPIGLARVSDAKEGLAVDGTLLLSDPTAARAYEHMKLGSIKGMSIGYNVPQGKAELRQDGARVLKEVHVFEISLVAVPCNPRAQVVNVKSLQDAHHVLQAYRKGGVDDESRPTIRAIAELAKELASDDENSEAEIKAQIVQLARELRGSVK